MTTTPVEQISQVNPTEIKFLCWLKYLPFVLLALLSTAHADEDLIELSGLNLPCDGCTQVDDQRCKIKTKNEYFLMPCDEAVTALLAELRSTDEYNGTHPSPAELRQFLLRNTVDAAPATDALWLLSETDTGTRAIENEAPRLVERYSSAIEELVANERGSQAMWLRFWRLPATDGIDISIRLRALIATKHPDVSLSDLLNDLGVATDASAIGNLHSTLEEFSPEMARDAAFAQEIISSCKEIFARGKSSDRCNSETIAELPESIRPFLHRVKLNLSEEWINNNLDKPWQALRLLGQTKYQDHRTPRTHRTVRQILKTINASDGADILIRLRSDELREMLSFYAANDPSIAGEYALTLVHAAHEAYNRQDLSRGHQLLNESYTTSSAELPARNSLIASLEQHPGVRRNIEHQKMLAQLSGVPLAPRGKQVPMWAIAVIVISVAVTCVVVLVLLRRRTLLQERAAEDGESTTQSNLAPEERAELRELLASFGLPGYADLNELNRCYRVSAKELHPDTNQGAKEEFTAMVEKYERAKELLEKHLLS